MNSLTEDIFNWLQEFFPSKMSGNYNLDEVLDLYRIGKESHVGEFKENDILSYDYLEDGIQKTAVAIFKCHERDESENSIMTQDGYYIFKTHLACFNIYENFYTMSKVKIAYYPDIKPATQEEKSRFFEIISNCLVQNAVF